MATAVTVSEAAVMTPTEEVVGVTDWDEPTSGIGRVLLPMTMPPVSTDTGVLLISVAWPGRIVVPSTMIPLPEEAADIV